MVLDSLDQVIDANDTFAGKFLPAALPAHVSVLITLTAPSTNPTLDNLRVAMPGNASLSATRLDPVNKPS